MLVQQIEVFLEDRVGELEKMAGTLSTADVDIKALTLTDACNPGSPQKARLIVSDPEAAVSHLKAQGYKAESTDVVIVELPDRPGGLDAVLKILCNASINIQYIYAFMSRLEKKALAVCRFDDNGKAIETLKKSGITLVTDQTIMKDSEADMYEEHRLGDYMGGMFPW